jgi:threonine dehydrogenase-like Zn-dependent dehydrogenase
MDAGSLPLQAIDRLRSVVDCGRLLPHLRGDPEPCGACAHGEWDTCRNGRYTERGVNELRGYASELWPVPADYAVRVDPHLGMTGVLMEPTSVVAKAWEQIDPIGARARFEPRTRDQGILGR